MSREVCSICGKLHEACKCSPYRTALQVARGIAEQKTVGLSLPFMAHNIEPGKPFFLDDISRATLVLDSISGVAFDNGVEVDITLGNEPLVKGFWLGTASITMPINGPSIRVGIPIGIMFLNHGKSFTSAMVRLSGVGFNNA